METAQPLNQQAIVILNRERYYIENGGSIGNCFVVSPFFLSACFGKSEYVAWKIGFDSTLVSEGRKRTFLIGCLGLDLGSSSARERLECVIARMDSFAENGSTRF
jgi:hypothetical protein